MDLRQSLIVALISIVFLALGDTSAQARRTVIQYDDQGRIIGVIEEDDPSSPRIRGSSDKAAKPDNFEQGEILAINPPKGTLRQMQDLGFSLIERMQLSFIGMTVWRIRVPENMGTEEGLAAFRRAFPNVISDYNQHLNLGSANAQNGMSLPYDRQAVGWGPVGPSCGIGVRLGMIDSPVDVEHRSLRGQKVTHKSFLRNDRKPPAGEHGTAIAVMLVGRPSTHETGGLVPGATLIAASIFEQRKGRTIGNLVAMLKAINWLAGQNVQVLNLSIAGSRNAVLAMATNRATELGMVLVAAAGNNGPEADPAWPAAHPSVIAVTAVDKNLSHYRYANQGGYIDFAAPGVGILTATPYGYKEQSGTSFAAPYLTSMVALHLAAGYRPDPESLRESLRRYAVDLGPEGRDDTFGWGLVRLRPDC